LTSKCVTRILGGSRWIGVQIAKAQQELRNGANKEETARALFKLSSLSLKRSREIVEDLKDAEYESFLEKRTHVGSAENPITKLFPAAVTERQFLDKLNQLHETRRSVGYRDERFARHTLVDFTLTENNLELPINVKNSGTRFENAAKLVGLEPDDCVPIPTYKAYNATEKRPNLLYAISADYTLISKVKNFLLTLFSDEEKLVWEILSTYAGSLIRDAEDRFVYSMVDRYWDKFSYFVSSPAFRIISARKAVSVLLKHPKRTPGIGLRAWGTRSAAENNVHISITNETKTLDEIFTRISKNGLSDIILAVNRKKTEMVFDPEV
jgi:hypothetical protein